MKFDFHYLFSAKYAQWLSVALICLFSLLIISECTKVQLSPLSPKVAPETEKNALVPSRHERADAILHSSLFGVYVPSNLNEARVKKSLLNVTLVGVLLAEPMEESQVIIRAASGSEKTYKLNDSVPGGAVIKRISANGVLVERHGNLESLSLPKNELIFEPVAKPLTEE